CLATCLTLEHDVCWHLIPPFPAPAAQQRSACRPGSSRQSPRSELCPERGRRVLGLPAWTFASLGRSPRQFPLIPLSSLPAAPRTQTTPDTRRAPTLPAALQLHHSLRSSRSLPLRKPL